MGILAKFYESILFLVANWPAVWEKLQAIGIMLLVVIGTIAVVATIIARISKKIIDFTDNKEADNIFGWVYLYANKIASFCLDILHFFPTFGTNPKTKELKDRLDELEAEKQADAESKKPGGDSV